MKANPLIIWDIEVLPNLFVVCFISMTKDTKVSFEISERKNQLEELRAFLLAYRLKQRFAGFNIVEYDYPVIDYLMHLPRHLTPREITHELYWKSKELFSEEKGYLKRVREPFLELVDIFLIQHFNSKVQATSLKKLEYQMKLTKVKELDLPWDKPVPVNRIDEVIDYCFYDCYATKLYYNENMDRIKFRDELTEQYDFDFTNLSDSKLGETVMRLEYQKATGIDIYRDRTYRERIVVKDLILPYIRFRSKAFDNMLKFFQDLDVKETKGSLTNLPFQAMDSYFGEGNYTVKKTKGKQENLNVIFDGITYVLGTGGLHASSQGEFVSDDEWMIVDVDVASYYPNLAIQNDLHPGHLGEAFCLVYAAQYRERKKHAKGTMLNLSIKLGLNSVYGKSNSKYSCFYDPQFTMAITINGQLLLLKLAEMILYHVGDDSKVIQANTDGITVRIRREHYDKLKHICQVWETNTKLELEYNNYSKMFVSDVNNYIAVYEDGGKVKRKGKFEYDVDDHQNHSNKASRKAAEAFLLHGTPIDVFLTNLMHTDKYDFFLLTNVNSKSKLTQEYGTHVQYHQRNSRYYISTPRKEASQLIKLMPPLPKAIAQGKNDWRRIEINGGFDAVIVNDNYLEHNYTFNLDFYVIEAQKLINRIYE